MQAEKEWVDFVNLTTCNPHRSPMVSLNKTYLGGIFSRLPRFWCLPFYGPNPNSARDFAYLKRSMLLLKLPVVHSGKLPFVDGHVLRVADDLGH